MSRPLLTLIIPTKNRADFLARLLRYYADLDFPHALKIGDSSDEIHAPKSLEAVRTYAGRLDVQYRKLEGPIAQCVYDLNQTIETPYATLVADDDFLIPAGLAKCMGFLDENKSYIAANGKSVLFTLKASGPYGCLRDVGHYKMNGLEGETGVKRLQNLLGDYFVSLFSVHRTEVWKEMWRYGAELPDVAIAAELLPCSLSAIYGKIKNLDALYLVRQGHDRRYILPDTFDRMRHPSWPATSQIFVDILTQVLSQRNNLSGNEVRENVQKAFFSYLRRGFLQQRRKNGPLRRMKEHLKNRASKIPAGGYALALFKYCLNGGGREKGSARELSLAGLIDPSSSYHEDFMTINKIVTAEAKMRPESLTWNSPPLEAGMRASRPRQ